MSPEPVKGVGILPRLGSRFRYSGRTHYETKKTPIERQPPAFERSLSGRRLTSQSMTGIYFHQTKQTLIDLIRVFIVLFFYFLNTKFIFHSALGGLRPVESYDTEPSKRHTMSYDPDIIPNMDNIDERTTPTKKQKDKVI